MTSKLLCPNGHKLRFDAKDGGKQAMCPKCHTRITLPRREVSDTSILAVLGDAASDRSIVMRPAEQLSPTAQLTPPTPARTCPRCRARVTAAFQLCPNCNTYLPPSCRDDLNHSPGL